MKLSAMPPFLLIMGGIILFMILLYVSSIAHGAIIVAAVICWLVVIATVCHSAGLIRGLDSLPVAGGLIRYFSLPPRRPQPVDSNSKEVGNEKPAEMKVDVARVNNARNQLQKLIGEHPAISAINNEIIPLAQSCATQNRRLLGAKKAWVAIIHGPSGVGKSTMAELLAELLIGYDAVANHVIIPFGAPISGQDPADLRRNIEQGVNSVLLVDDARWLADDSGHGYGPNNRELFFGTLSSVVDHDPGKMAVIVTLTTEQYEKISPALNEYTRRMTCVRLECNTIDREPLYDLFVQKLQEKGIDLDAKLKPRILKIIETNAKKREFYYAYAMQKWVEWIETKLISMPGVRVATAEIINALQEEIDKNHI